MGTNTDDTRGANMDSNTDDTRGALIWTGCVMAAIAVAGGIAYLLLV